MEASNKTAAFPMVSLESSGRYVILPAGEFTVAKVYNCDHREKFAMLFAASPVLLKFAQDFLSAYQSGDDLNLKWFANEAYTAIVKALGECDLS